MQATLSRLRGADRVMLSNAGALVGTTAANSLLGVAYWWVAANAFPSADVGLASAAIAAMTLLSTVGMLGLGTLLISEIARAPRRAGRLLGTAMLVSGAASALMGLAFALLAPWLSADLRPLADGALGPLAFAAGTGLTGAALVLDQALVGLLWSDLQLWRNLLFAGAKLALVFAAGLLLLGDGMTMYITWAVAQLLSLVVAAALLEQRGVRLAQRHDWSLLRRLGGAALWHHGFNLAQLAPGLLLPLIVTGLLSAAINAGFYLAWMLVGMVFVAPTALTTVLHVFGAADRAGLARATRQSLGLSLAATLLAGGALFAGADWLLRMFGDGYAEQATWCLRILCLGGLPAIVKTHYIAICRATDDLPAALPRTIAGATLELALAALGARLGGLTGLSLGWLAAMGLQAALMGGVVRQAAGWEWKRERPAPAPLAHGGNEL